MTFVTGVLSKDVPKTWPQVRRFIEAGLGEDGVPSQRIYERLLRAECQLLVALDKGKIIAACVTELATKDNITACNILCIGGSGLNEWLHYLPSIEMWALGKERKKILIEHARPAWARILKDSGYQIKSVVLEKVL